MSQRQFLSTFIWLVLVNLLIKAIFIFGIDLQVQRQVGPSSYGLYFTLLNLCYIFQIINDFGLNLLHNTDTAQHGHVRLQHWRKILQIKIFLSITYALIVFGIAHLVGFTASWQLLLWLVINNIFISWITLLRSSISGMARYNWEALISVMDKVLMILICGILFFTQTSFQIEWFVWAQTASLIITFLTAGLISKNVSGRNQTGQVYQEANVEVIFKAAVPFCVATLLMYLYSRSDSILIKKLLVDGDHEAGIYAAGFRLLDAANMISFLVTPLLIPMYARLEKDKTQIRELMHLAGGLMISMSGCIAIASYWWGQPIMQLCYGHSDPQWVNTFKWLILGHVPVALMYVYGSYLTAIGQMWKQNILFLFSVCINFGLNFWLIPYMGTVGAALTSFVTQSFTTAMLIYLTQKQLQLPPNTTRIGKSLAFFVILVISGWALHSISWSWIITIILFVLTSITSAFLLQLVDVRKITALLKEQPQSLT
jgi:O-antigen/teichoic acid export membrane protein